MGYKITIKMKYISAAVLCLVYNVQAIKVTESREPLLTWAPTPKKGHKVDYFVPNFGADADMVDQASHVTAAEAKLGHVWTPHRDEDDEKWVVPKEDAQFKLMQIDAEINREPLL